MRRSLPRRWRHRARRALAAGSLALAAAGARAAEVGPAAPSTLAVQLRWAGAAFAGQAPPDFSCRDESTHEWYDCHLRPAETAAAGAYTMPRPRPGRHMLHVEVDENPGNPRRFPGDYDVFHPFVVTSAGPTTLEVDLQRVLHVTSPWDNERALDGLLTAAPERLPSFTTPRFQWRPAAPVTFVWEPVLDGAAYDVVITDSTRTPRFERQEILRRQTTATTLTVTLPPSAPGRYFEFGLAARKDGRYVGELLTHDAGAQGWTLSFTVRDGTVPRWAYAAAASLFALLALAVTFAVRTASRRTWAAVTAVALVALAAAGLWQRQRARRTRLRAAESAASAAVTAERAREADRAFVAAWRAAVPPPPWLDEAARGAAPFATLGDLLAAWQGGDTRSDAGRRRFFAQCYRAVVEHAGDRHLVATAIDLMRFVGDQTVDRRALVRFWLDHFFDYAQRTDNCANCMPGDTTADVVRDAAASALADGDVPGALALLERLEKERFAAVSAWSQAETLEALARAHSAVGDPRRAADDIRRALTLVAGDWRSARLTKALDAYQRASGRQAPRNPG